MIDHFFSNFSRYTILRDCRESWLYFHRFCCGFILFLILISIDKNETGQGGNFFHYSTVLFAIALTFSAITTFSSAVTQDKENQSLGLILLTNSSSSEYLRGRFFGRSTHLISLLLLLLPIALFSITLGGITLQQILQAFIALGIWLSFVSLASFWASCLFSNSKEALIMSISICSSLVFIMMIFQFSPIHRINQVMDFTGYNGYFILDFLIYALISKVLLKSIKENFEFAATTPISFWDEYSKKLSLKRQSIEPKFVHSVVRKRVSTSPIKDKDKNLIHRSFNPIEYARIYPFTSFLLSIICLALFPILMLFVFFYIPYIFFKMWSDMTKIFDLEFTEGTFSSLAILPYTKEEFLKEKFAYFKTSVQVLYFLYAMITLGLIAIMSANAGELIPSLIILGASPYFLFLPGLMYFIKYLNLIIIFSSKRVDRLNLFFSSLTIVFLYFFVPIFLPLGIPYLKKLCYRKMDECIAYC